MSAAERPDQGFYVYVPDVEITTLNRPVMLVSMLVPEVSFKLFDKKGAQIDVVDSRGHKLSSSQVWRTGLLPLVPVPIPRPFYEKRLARAKEEACHIAAAYAIEEFLEKACLNKPILEG